MPGSCPVAVNRYIFVCVLVLLLLLLCRREVRLDISARLSVHRHLVLIIGSHKKTLSRKFFWDIISLPVVWSKLTFPREPL